MDQRELMRVHVETLFRHDASGRMVSVNERSGQAAPKFFLGRTARGNVCRFRYDLDDALVQELEAACSSEAVDKEYRLPPYGASRYEELLARTARIQKTWAGPTYHFPPELPGTPDTVFITSEKLDLLRPHFTSWLDDVADSQPFLALLAGGVAVSVCCSVRRTLVAHEAGAETHRDFRGRGYATQVAWSWAAAVRAAGQIPLYSTSWLNAASLAVAQNLRLIRYGSVVHIT